MKSKRPRRELELEPSGPLDLTLAVLSTACAGNRAERIEVVQGRSVARSRVHRCLDAENVRAVRDVESFGKKLQIHRFRQLESLRQTSIKVDEGRQAEAVSRQDRNLVAAEASVQTRTLNGTAVRSTREVREDR